MVRIPAAGPGKPAAAGAGEIILGDLGTYIVSTGYHSDHTELFQAVENTALTAPASTRASTEDWRAVNWQTYPPPQLSGSALKPGILVNIAPAAVSG